MKTLSNAELQDAIRYSTECVKNCLQKSNEYQLHLEQLVALLDEQRRRASERVEYTGAPMTTTLDRAAFEARAKAPDSYHFSGGWYGGNENQDGPEWVEWSGGECPVPFDHKVEIELYDGFVDDRVPAGDLNWVSTNKPYAIARYKDWTAWEQSK